MTPEQKIAIHLTDSCGKPWLTRKHQEAEIDRLKAENDHLRMLLKKTVTALKSTRNKSVDSNIHH